MALAIESDTGFARLAQLLKLPGDRNGKPSSLLAERHYRHDELDVAIAAWAKKYPAERAAQLLQEAGIAAAPLLHADDLLNHPEYFGTDFFVDLIRECSGPQRQAGVAIVCDGERLGSRRPAPLLGEHSWEVLREKIGLSRTDYDAHVQESVISFTPAPTRNLVAAAKS